ncbi:MAG: hypothetical protein F6K56_07045 [Moorea sp. SIO3G5]|nr:hypothetical protein [Moorena sp. SIO3G5]
MMKITACLARMSTPELLPLASCLLPIPTQILFQHTLNIPEVNCHIRLETDDLDGGSEDHSV